MQRYIFYFSYPNNNTKSFTAVRKNRDSIVLFPTIYNLTLVSKDSNVIHYLAKLPAHPSIPRSCKLVGANYFETDNFLTIVDSP